MSIYIKVSFIDPGNKAISREYLFAGKRLFLRYSKPVFKYTTSSHIFQRFGNETTESNTKIHYMEPGTVVADYNSSYMGDSGKTAVRGQSQAKAQDPTGKQLKSTKGWMVVWLK